MVKLNKREQMKKLKFTDKMSDTELRRRRTDADGDNTKSESEPDKMPK